MKLTTFSLGSKAAWLPLGLLCLAQGGAQEAPAERGGLQRVDPERLDPAGALPGSPDDPRDVARAFAKDFQRSEWSARLSEPDLDRRERSFDLLLKRARLDPVARVFVEELACDPNGGELAWTARMALRQLGRPSLPLHFMLPGADPLGSAKRMQQMLEELLAEAGQGFHFPPFAPGPGWVGGNDGLAGRSIHVEQSPQGARIRITLQGAEEGVTHDYEGESLEAILREHPELERELAGLSLRAEAGARLDLRFAPDAGRGPGGARLFGFAEQAPSLLPQGRSRPIITDRLGVIVQPLDPARALELGLDGQGLRVERTYPETYAQLLGVGAGSILLELDGETLAAAADIERAMRARHPGDPLRLVWLDELGQRQEKTWNPEDG